MTESELKAIVALLDDDDREVRQHIEEKIFSLGPSMIPYLEEQWQASQFDAKLQKRIEDLVHQLQYRLVGQNLTQWKAEGGEDLLRGMWIVANYQYPDLSFEELNARMQQLFFEAWLDFKPDLRPSDQIRLLNDIFYNKLKFKANTTNFHAVGNSLINTLLETRRGNPIGLCVIYLLMARRFDLPIYGVNLPNLFILTYQTPDVQFYINAFNRGLIFNRKDIDNYLLQLNLNPSPTFYNPCSHLDIVRRVLRNLSLSYEKIGEPDKVEEVKGLLRLISDGEDN
ncbi:MAG: transglutaminase-like domain-containing protein [Bernardetiaceae bacterium]|jgi:regulator of sirC expression with transglutaminase-like and TPR domain|nr:transglutaminase-like domain-containing protein [Bernardetiaceae bacterium]